MVRILEQKIEYKLNQIKIFNKDFFFAINTAIILQSIIHQITSLTNFQYFFRIKSFLFRRCTSLKATFWHLMKSW